MGLSRHVRSVAAKSPLPNIYSTFAVALDRIWRANGQRERLGLAISGGVDSMALATLSHQASSTGHWAKCEGPTFTGFIVDHRLRPGSTTEAHLVAEELDRLSIRPHILTLDWPSDPATLPNLESVARRLRYRALGRACRDAGMGDLLVAHHADDQAETALMRIVAGYVGAGLAGMKKRVALPECRGVYGVDGSGSPEGRVGEMRVESGGVVVSRPLLGVRKEDLVGVCRENGVKWFEDHTNADVTLTMRNAVRSLLKDEEALPKALRHDSLLAVAEKRASKEAESEDTTVKLMDTIALSLNLRAGQVTFTLDSEARHQLSRDKDVARRVIRRILGFVSPKPVIPLQDLDQALALTLLLLSGNGSERMSHADDARDRVQVAGVQLQRHPRETKKADERSFVVFRALPPAVEQKGLEEQLWPYRHSDTHAEAPASADTWRLWDGRYWIRVQPPEYDVQSELRVFVRLLNKDGLAKLRSMSEMAKEVRAGVFDRLKGVEPYDARLTLPAIFARRPDEEKSKSENGETEQIVALPSLGWYAAGWTGEACGQGSKQNLWRCEVRYKHIELKGDQSHVSLSEEERPG